MEPRKKMNRELSEMIKWCNRLIIFMSCVLVFQCSILIDMYIGSSRVHAQENTEIPPERFSMTAFCDTEVVTAKIEEFSSGERIVQISQLEKEEPEYRMEIDDKTLEVLTRVVEAEVTGSTYRHDGEELTYEELLQSKIRVAQVYMNRVEDEESFSYIDDLYESLTYKNASSTFKDGRYYEVEITDITREAVRLALLADTPDYTEGALFFSSGTTKNKYGDLLFVDKVGHAFFK